MPNPLPSVQDIILALDHRSEADTGSNQIALHKKYDLDDLVPLYVAAYPHIRNWIGRKYVLFWTQRYARTNPEVVELAKLALKDKSWKVRYDACGALAYAFDRDSIPLLQELLSHSNEHTRADAAAAIEAITARNHHLYLDREGSGKHFWVLNPGDDPRGIL